MNWAEMIQMRALKESPEANCGDLSFYPDEYQHAIEVSLRHLPSYQQQAISLRFWQGLPIARVADHLGMSWHGADKLIDEALAALRQHLTRWKLDRQQQIGPLAF